MTGIATSLRHNGARLAACLAPLTLTGAIGATAALASHIPYTVKVQVVKPTVPKANSFSVVVTGVSSNTSQLIVYLNETQKCANTVAAEAALPGDAQIIDTTVTGPYARTQSEVAHFIGRHYACAYLRSTPPPTPVLLRARAGAPYTVINATG